MTLAARKITIADVAVHAGVTKSTVSHALSGKRPIGAATRKRIELAVRELGYRPNFAARVLNTRKTGLIAFLVSNLANHHSVQFAGELSQELAACGLQMILAQTEERESVERVMREFSNGIVDGIINGLPDLSAEAAERCAGSVPVVTCMRNRESNLSIDFAAGARNAMEYLYSLGHRKIAFVHCPSRGQAGHGDPCAAGYRDFLAKAQLPALEFVAEREILETGVALAPRVLTSGVTAVLAGNDSIACGMVQWALANQVEIPGRLSVIGHDDVPLASMISPPLTTIRVPITPQVRHVVQLLRHRIGEAVELPGPETIVPELIYRQSTQGIAL